MQYYTYPTFLTSIRYYFTAVLKDYMRKFYKIFSIRPLIRSHLRVKYKFYV